MLSALLSEVVAIFGGPPQQVHLRFVDAVRSPGSPSCGRTQNGSQNRTNACIGCSIFVYAAPNFKVSFKGLLPCSCSCSCPPFAVHCFVQMLLVLLLMLLFLLVKCVCVCVCVWHCLRVFCMFVSCKHLQKATHAAKLHNEATLATPFPAPLMPVVPHIVAAPPCCLTKSINTMQAQHDGATFRGHIHIHILLVHPQPHTHLEFQVRSEIRSFLEQNTRKKDANPFYKLNKYSLEKSIKLLNSSYPFINAKDSSRICLEMYKVVASYKDFLIFYFNFEKRRWATQ